MNKFYVYFHINPVKNEIFYVGKGKGNRARSKDRNDDWKKVVEQYGYIINIIEEGLTEQEALDKESFYIKKIGRIDLGKGTLVNKTDGYEGFSGVKKTRESIEKTNTFNKGNTYHLGHKHTDETKRRLSEISKRQIGPNKGKKFSDDHKLKLSLAKSGRKLSDEIKKRMSESQKNSWSKRKIEVKN